MFKNNALVLAKMETEYGTDPTPTKVANAILCDLPEIEFVMKKLDRLNVKPFLGNRPAINIGEAMKIKFNTEVRGCGDATPSIPPEIGVLFKGCGMEEVVVADTSYTYTPTDDIDGPSITIWFYQHDILHQLTGCRGSWVLEGKAGEPGKIAWDFTGLYAGPTDTTIPTDPTFNATLPPVLKSGDFSLGAFEGTIENFKLDFGNEIVKRPDVNAASGFQAHFIKDRSVTAEIDPEATALSTFDPLTLLTAGTEQAMEITFGTAAGNRMTVSCPKVVLDSVKYAERENILIYSLPLQVCPSSGEDDVSILFN